MRYALVGYGRMGREIEAAAGRRGHALGLVVDPSESGRRIRRRLEPAALSGIEVAFEFTAPGSAEANVVALLAAGIPVVCGTTGWPGDTPAVRRALREGKAGAVIAPNFSVGVNLFFAVVREAARRFGAAADYDPYVLEAHHRGKADHPSGTARRLGELIVEEDPRRWTVQEGMPPGPLPPGAVPIVSVRAGQEPGTHVVGFDGSHDGITLTHRSRSRTGFAEGAVHAAEWLQGRRGLHRFEEVLAGLAAASRQA